MVSFNKIYFLVIVSTALIQSSCLETEDDLKHEIDLLTKDFLDSLKLAHNLVDIEEDDEVGGRGKRSAEVFQRRSDHFFEKGVFRLSAIVPRFSTCDRPIDFTTIAFNSKTYGICVSAPDVGHRARISIGPVTQTGWEKNMIYWYVRNPKNVVSFVDEDKDTRERNLYVLVADADRADGTDVHIINKHNQMINNEQHTVNSQYPTAIAVWKSRADSTYHLAIANSHGPNPTKTYRSETFTYRWMQTYFDRYSEMATYFVRDICSFNIHSNEFLAVANFMAGPDHPDVDSEIFRMDIDRKKWISFQRIRTYGAIDWEFFTLGSNRSQEYFLVVANNLQVVNGQKRYDVNSVIYKFSDDKFVPLQPLATSGATQVKSYKGPNGEFVLAVANMYQDVVLYQYNGWKFVRTGVQHTNGVMSKGAVSLHFDYLSFERTGALFVSNPQHPTGHVFRMEFHYENPLGEWRKQSLKWCQDADLHVNNANNDLGSHFHGVHYVDQREPIIIEDDLVFSDLVVDNLETPLIIDEFTGDELSHRLVEELVRLDQQIGGLNGQMDQIINTLNNALRTSGDQVVTAPMTFDSVDFECRPESDCYFGKLDTKILNNDFIEGLAGDVVPLNQKQVIRHPMHFQHLIVDKNIVANATINGLNISHIVTKHGSHDIIGTKTFATNLTANEVVAKEINGRIINPTTVLLTIGDQVIRHPMTFTTGIHVSNLQVDGPINGHDINRFLADVITRDGNHVIRDHKRFQKLDMVELEQQPGSTINGVDVMKMWNEVLWTYGEQEVVAPINFTDISIDGNLLVDGLINGISIPNDVILRHQNAIITGKKRFTRPQRLNKMEVMDSINGIGLVNGQLDILLKSRPQTIIGHKVFGRIHLGGHSRVDGTVDGVKLSQLRRTLLYRNTSQHFDTLEIKGNAYFDGGVDLKNTINGRKIEDLYNNALKLTDRVIPAFPDLTIMALNSRHLKCHHINGLDIERDLVTKKTPQLITGLKRFRNNIRVDNDMTVNSINEVVMNHLFNDTLLRDIPQRITGHKTFVNELWAKDLTTPSINNISMNELIRVNSPVEQTIVGQKTFDDVRVNGDLNVDSLEAQVINGVNLKELYENTLQYERPQLVTGRMSFSSIGIPKGTNLVTKTVNGVDLNQMMADAVLVDVPQTVTGSKTFMAPIAIERTRFTNNFDGVTDHELRHEWLMQDRTQTIVADVDFGDTVKVDNTVVMKVPVINGINLEVLANQSVKVDEPAVITGHVVFDNQPVIAEGHIKLSGRVQGIDLDKEAVTLDGNHVINGRIHFLDGFNVDQHLQVNGMVDGVRVEELCRAAVRKNMPQVIAGPTEVRGDLVIRGPIFVDGLVNGINLTKFEASVLKVDEPALLRGVNRFRELILNGPVDSTHPIGGLRIDELWNNYMSLTRDQVVNSQMVFLNDLVFRRGLAIKGHLLTPHGMINGINLPQLDSTVFRTYGDQTITANYTFVNNVYFDNNLTVADRTINGLDLINDLMLKGRNNIVNAPKIFAQTINVLSNLDIADGKTIAGVDVSELARFAVMKTGNYTIGGDKHFQALEVDHLTVRRINGAEISPRNLLLTVGHQVITGRKTINGLVANHVNIDAMTVNHINIANLSRSLVLKGANNTIHSSKTFNSPLTVHNVLAYGRVDGVNLNELNYFIGLPVNLHDLRVKLDIEDQKIAAMQTALDHQSVQLEFYELVSTVRSGPALLLYYNPQTRSQHLFIAGQHQPNGCHEINVFDSSRGFKLVAQKLFAIEANLMTNFRWNSDQFVIISNVLKKMKNKEECLGMNSQTVTPVYGNGPAVSQVFVFDVQHLRYRQIATIRTESLTDVKVVQDSSQTPCLVMANPVANSGRLEHPIVYCMANDGHFWLNEKTPSYGTDQISVVRSSSVNRTLMAEINSWQSSGMSSVVVSDWSSKLSHFDHSIQSIPVLNPLAVHFTETLVDSSVFLFVSEKKTSLTHRPLVRVFLYTPRNNRPLVEVQHIKHFEVKQIESVLLDDHRLLVLMLSTDRIDLYRRKGSSGFVRIDRIDVQNAQSFVIANDYESRRIDGHVIAVSLKECYAKNRFVCEEKTHILRSKFTNN